MKDTEDPSQEAKGTQCTTRDFAQLHEGSIAASDLSSLVVGIQNQEDIRKEDENKLEADAYDKIQHKDFKAAPNIPLVRRNMPTKTATSAASPITENNSANRLGRCETEMLTPMLGAARNLSMRNSDSEAPVVSSHEGSKAESEASPHERSHLRSGHVTSKIRTWDNTFLCLTAPFISYVGSISRY